jgi:hypothetical protein
MGGDPMEDLAEPHLESWVRRAITHYRAMAAKEDSLVMEKVRDELNLDSPCQVQGFSVDDPPWQAFIVTHIGGMEDQLVVTKENIPRWGMFETMTDAFLNPIWDQPLSTKTNKGWRFLSRREAGFHVMDQLLSMQRSTCFLSPERHIRFVQHINISGDIDTYNHTGSMSELAPEAWVDDAFKNGRQRWKGIQEWQAAQAANPDPPLPAAYAERPYPAHGIFHARHVRIGLVTSSKLGDWYTNQRDFPGIITHRDHLGPFAFKATQNGFLCIETPDKHEAHRWFNRIMAGFLSEGLPAVVVHEHEIGGVHLPQHDGQSWGGSFHPLERRSTLIFDQNRISVEELSVVLRKAEHHSTQPYATHIPAFLEAHTHLEGNEPTQSFVFSWAIIEPVVSSKWSTYVASKAVSSARRKKLEGSDWTLDARSEALQLAGLLDQDLYDRLNTVRKIRNRVFHGEQAATMQEAEQALALADSLLTQGGAPLRGPKKKSAQDLWLEELL